MKGRREHESFIALPHGVIQSENWRAMSPYAVKLFIDLYSQYRGSNNGDFTAAWSVMKPKGWRSKGTLHKALKELEWFGMIDLTRRGGLNRCNLYAVTFKPIDECKGKLDVSATRLPSRRWSVVVAPFSNAKKTRSPALPMGHAGSSGSPAVAVSSPV